MDLPLPVRLLLAPLSWLYGAAARVKAALYARGWLGRRRLAGAVVSVGNLTVGGTGKTPMVLWLGERLTGEGKSVAVLSRGYRGANGGSDEVDLLRRRLGGRVRFGVGPDRFVEGSALERQAPVDVFLLDDGFQHLRLARDVDIVMLDGSRRLEREWLLPAGRLREPASAARRADLFVVTRGSERPVVPDAAGRLFHARTRLLGLRRGSSAPAPPSEAGPGPFFAFCGIGNPGAFFEDLERWRLAVAGSRAFRDHHVYPQGEMTAIERAAAASGAVALVTTEKDEQNLRGTFGLPLYVAVIELELRGEQEFLAALRMLLARRSAP